MRVIILNGPPNIGKDTLGNNVQQLIGWPRMEFKEALYSETASYYGVDLVTFAMLASGRTTKEVPMPTLGGLSPRQAMIHVSEEVIKPKFGKQFFGAKAYELIQTLEDSTDTVVFSDGGFVEEAEYLVGMGYEVHIIQLHAEGRDFGNDSRDYITVGGATSHRINVTLGQPMADLTAFVNIFFGETE